jgi:hypothetical protein
MSAPCRVTSLAENTAEIQRRGRPFERGQSGNPLGRPKGSRNKTTLMAEALLDEQSQLIVSKVVEMALQGDSLALRICADRLLPKRERPVQFEMPPIETLEDGANASKAVLAACAQGDLSPGEASKVLTVISSHMANLQLRDMNERLRELERKSAGL